VSSINRLNKVSALAAEDLLAIFSQQLGSDASATLATLTAYLQEQLTADSAPTTQYSAPSATGFSVTIAPPVDGGSVWLLLTPAAGYAAGTVVLPAQASCVDGQEVLVSCTQAVTTLTVNGNGSTVNGAPATLAANAFFRLRFDGVFKAWYRAG
jgi:hypothetical protein